MWKNWLDAVLHWMFCFEIAVCSSELSLLICSKEIFMSFFLAAILELVLNSAVGADSLVQTSITEVSNCF